ncbi:DoxX family protein [Christiangramia forsetii]|uniref:Membrane protein n=2 Tax=Christiangramia forsetii TaxID=411153 RepID=A0M657_CHRFK|nr:MauE/DoxX family redox-associated membrane protein [Christiangramia forsetii]GGG31338.1 hypothetical protein GCM10011532_13530 [Christiangramia forsetii]CAL68102.1 membrane protein [Christiangramia forsetii KT0803]
MSYKQLAYFLARITLGINFFIHGLVRMPKLAQFADGVVDGFEKSMLPAVLVKPIAFAIPFVELILGGMILLGIFSRKALTAAAILMIILIVGSAFKEDWAAVGTQMLYALYIFFLIFYLENDVKGLWLKKAKQ